MYQGITPSPDPGFVRKLKEFDPTLRVEFSRELETFVIMQPSKKYGEVIATVCEGDGEKNWRQPDGRDLAELRAADWHRRRQEHRDRLREGVEKSQQIREKQDAFAEDELKARTREDKRQLFNTVAKATNSGKGVTGYRQVENKPKGTKRDGYTVIDRRKI